MIKSYANEQGRLGLLQPEDTLRAIGAVRSGETWSLGLDIFGPGPVPNLPFRPAPLHIIYQDWSHYQKGRVTVLPGGVGSVDDGVLLSCHGGTHLDALGHIICEGTIFGGKSATTTIGGLTFGDVSAIAQRGVVCRAILIDLFLLFNGPVPCDHEITQAEIAQCLTLEKMQVEKNDMLLIRTGSLSRWSKSPSSYFENYMEPGLSDDAELIDWFDTTQVLGIGTDTFSNELARSPRTGDGYPLHRYLLRDRGMQFHEALWLEELASSCAEDSQYCGLYIAIPLKLRGASGCPVNPLFIK